MSDNHKNSSESIREWIAEQEKEDRIFLQEVWEQTAAKKDHPPEITETEVEEALSAVHRKIGKKSSDSHYHELVSWPKLAAAALLVIAVGLGYLFYPQTQNAPLGELSTVELPDGTEVELNSGTEISYNRLFGITNRDVNLQGEAYFSVRSDAQPFRVQASETTVEVTGTAFNVRSWPEDAAEVAVGEGSVAFYSNSNREQEVRLEKGEFSRWSPEMKRPVPAETINAEDVGSWREQKLNFNKRTLTSIFDEIERYFDVDIQFEEDELADETLTAYYTDPEDAEAVIRDICRVKGLKYAPTANGYRIYK